MAIRAPDGANNEACGDDGGFDDDGDCVDMMVAFNMSSRLPLPAPGRDNKCLQTWSPLSAFGPLVLSTSRALSACV